jgi:hypothetical protein
MSALGHKRTFAVQNGMSALPPKADMCGALAHVCFVPIADIEELQSKPLPFHRRIRVRSLEMITTATLPSTYFSSISET